MISTQSTSGSFSGFINMKTMDMIIIPEQHEKNQIYMYGITQIQWVARTRKAM
jgi:hypothetical protein